MGILNVTPDSFSDGGRHAAADAALVHARSMIAEGADIIDIGAESTRPGAAAVDASEEWARLEPVLAPVIALGVPVSIDTYKADIARRACALGSAIVNDVWGLQKDPGMADVVAAAGVPVVMMHNRVEADASIDILADMDRFFERSMQLADQAGIARERQILDPGFGFGKTMDQNYLVLNRLDHVARHGLPILAGASRKRMIGAVLDVPTGERLFGSLAVHLLAAERGAVILRVHDVKAHVEALAIQAAMRRERVALVPAEAGR